ncbi:uncharacterized protein BO97DRAFT_37470 [Aspergillus homomorphus CBS 101889]|uniref:Uncharacterized protein n=1 Tax=Aspergillus homomorphus (strain CBS 101889) TaxID=1450537 RepID=A0A395I0K5_ASPHC|nr:hypothetical protein BO97DRAFT_37470 [Aspergillus homomorphus CBS 101889]RAL13326.1 hypothetical protein BO97DRAFT_37470 [Aspergillus homomorphus CBS 101889]
MHPWDKSRSDILPSHGSSHRQRIDFTEPRECGAMHPSPGATTPLFVLHAAYDSCSLEPWVRYSMRSMFKERCILSTGINVILNFGMLWMGFWAMIDTMYIHDGVHRGECFEVCFRLGGLYVVVQRQVSDLEPPCYCTTRHRAGFKQSPLKEDLNS